jgi:hypothetical protein
MNLKDCPVAVYGDTSFRGDCPKEEVEQVSFFARLRREYPDTWGAIAIHPRNEGLKVGRQFHSVMKHQAEGMTKGAADIVIPACPSFVCELKRRDHTKSAWQDNQLDYLAAAKACGAFACVALGADAAWQAFDHWLHMVRQLYPDRAI